MAGLFGDRTVLDERSQLHERWLQEDATHVHIEESVVADETIYTVSSGKILYVKDIFVTMTVAGVANASLIIRDSGDDLIRIEVENYVKGDVIQFTTDVPFKFDTSVFINENSAGIGVHIVMTGWEE